MNEAVQKLARETVKKAWTGSAFVVKYLSVNQHDLRGELKNN